MPGTIQVSVLDIKELPSSSNSVKVSLGKVEYEAAGKGTFLFPLTNLRDNLIITVQDSEGNQVSHSGVRTMPIIEKGTWDDVFPIEGGGLIHMKLQFILNDEERNRIRLMRESAMKKKQAEILGSRLKSAEIAKSLASSLHRHENVTDRSEKSEQTPNPSGNLVEKSYEKNLEEKNSLDVKETSEESTSTPLLQEAEIISNKNNEIPSQPAEVPENLKNNKAAESKPLDNLVEKLDTQDPEEKYVEKTSKESKLPPFSQETEVNTIKNNEIQLQKADLPKRLQDASSGDVGSSRLTIAQKIKSFSPKLSGEQDKQGSTEKTPCNIKKMISVFESGISQDRVPLKPLSTKSYRVGNNIVKDYYEKLESSQEKLKNSETSSSTRLRNSFSTGDLRENLSSIIKGDEVASDDNFVDSSEINKQSEGINLKGTEQLPKEGLNNEKKVDLTETSTTNLPKSLEENATVSGRMLSDDKRNHTKYTEKESNDVRRVEEKGHQKKIVASIPEAVKGEVQYESDVIVKQGEEMESRGSAYVEMESEESAHVEASNGSLGQVMKIALVVGFGVLVLLFRQREPGKGKNKGNKHAPRNQVLMNKREPIEERRRRISVSRLS